MSVKVRLFKNGGWEVDVRVMLPDGSMVRERRKAPVSSKSGAQRWGEARERELVIHGPRKPRKEVPTLAEFGPRFLERHARANRQKPSGIASKETILRVHLIPILGSKRLDAINNEDVQCGGWHSLFLHEEGVSSGAPPAAPCSIGSLREKEVPLPFTLLTSTCP